MTLNDLEFKAEDFANRKMGIYPMSPQGDAALANDILRERLENAPIVMLSDCEWKIISGTVPQDVPARLVCIEEIKK